MDELWASALTSLQNAEITPQQRVFLSLCKPLTLVEGTLLLAVPNEFTKETLENQLKNPLNSSLTAAAHQPIAVAITIDKSIDIPQSELDQNDQMVSTEPDLFTAAREAAKEADQPVAGGARQTAQRHSRNQDKTQPPLGDDGSRLNPKYVFDAFVIGSSNRFPHAAAVAVAEQPARAYNPLFIYGESGLGKTHLLHAIGHYSRNLYPSTRVRYVSSEEFTNDFINSIRDDKSASFQRRYREVDVLLIDDIQFLSGKVQTQEEFFHTFNTLHNANKQIVVTSDLPPKQLHEFEERMRNRFEWGLMTDIQPPDLETRIAILRKKVAAERLVVPASVMEFIADRITTNIRELEGALIRVSAFANLNRQPVDVALAEVVLRDLLPDQTSPEITLSMIMSQTANYFGFSLIDLTGASRSRSLVTARQVAMYLCRELTDLSLPKVGQAFGGRDHTTVMHAERKIRQLMAERRGLYNQVADLTARIRSQAKTAA
jgi:chromosomal replication initiator protein